MTSPGMTREVQWRPGLKDVYSRFGAAFDSSRVLEYGDAGEVELLIESLLLSPLT